jgi:hypothetical protein
MNYDFIRTLHHCLGYELYRERGGFRSMIMPTSEEERVGCDFRVELPFAFTVQPKRLRWQRGANNI